MAEEQARLDQQIDEEEARVGRPYWMRPVRDPTMRSFVAAVEAGAAGAGQESPTIGACAVAGVDAGSSRIASIRWSRLRHRSWTEEPRPWTAPRYEWPPRKPKPVVAWPRPLWKIR